MVMIFTGQENIDDVIFFPMMRPSIAPLNAAIYGVHEASVAPVEDLVLSVEDFEALCKEGSLKPHATNLVIKPHLRIWSPARASGHIEIEGFLPNSVLRLSGYKVDLKSSHTDEAHREEYSKSLELTLVKLLREKFPGCHIAVSPPTVMRQA
jgi:hypothetical protein